jgi:hypothetical protein
MQRTVRNATRNRRPKRTAPRRSRDSVGEGLAALRCPVLLHHVISHVLGAALPAGFGMAGFVPQGNLALCLERKAKARLTTRIVGQSIALTARGASHPPRISALSALAIVQRFVPGGWRQTGYGCERYTCCGCGALLLPQAGSVRGEGGGEGFGERRLGARVRVCTCARCMGGHDLPCVRSCVRLI